MPSGSQSFTKSSGNQHHSSPLENKFYKLRTPDEDSRYLWYQGSGKEKKLHENASGETASY
jgi:hypothetical protein